MSGHDWTAVPRGELTARALLLVVVRTHLARGSPIKIDLSEPRAKIALVSRPAYEARCRNGPERMCTCLCRTP